MIETKGRHTDTKTEESRGARTEQKLQSYYRLHSKVYDATRWSFLFGRESLLNRLPDLPPRPRILEIGCGTGRNIEYLQYLFPDAHIYGVDLSAEMLKKAHRKINDSRQVTLMHSRYGSEPLDTEAFDLILLSYSLTMTGDRTEAILQQIYDDLKAHGHIAVVDFHYSPFRWFRRWMKKNHVVMDGSLLSLLHKYFHPKSSTVHDAYLGLWSYLEFIGKRG